ncbi:glycosyltransferase [Lacibacter luteus]|uniref:Glycosyltransferase n=1 Tax=Lacibacter luteus TaxID=2508719 RepID=A0A4Q1CIW0_9BACT|nr:glycosyltransferase [Lacibacter luteus]RXK60019.1 glycosyltransferase [Lacibacter luteus]
MLVSIIIPSYNHEKYISKCIDSVLKQTYINLELIIIDDGSVDSSNEIISAYTDHRIQHIKQSNNGAHNAINKGLALSKGDYLTILNSDDLYHPTRIEKCLQIFQNDSTIDFISTWLDIINVNETILGTKMAWRNMEPWNLKNKELTFAGSPDYALNALMANFVSTTSNMIFKRTVYEKIGGMRNLRFTHDWDFLLRVCSNFNCFNLEESLLSYRIHETNTISSNRKWMLFEICWIIASNIDRFNSKLIPSLKKEDFSFSSIRLLESFNFQGNDHIFWLLYWQINNMQKMGIVNPEEIYLSNKVIRDEIIEYVKE